MRICSGFWCALLLLCAWAPAAIAAPDTATDTAPAPHAAPAPKRPLHIMVSAGGYASLGGPAGYGPQFAIDLLPGGFAGRFGARAEWRGYGGVGEGSGLVGLLYEAGASRPILALQLLAELGLSAERDPIVGAGVETCLWLLGPVGVVTLADVQVILDGLGTRPALSISLGVQLGR